MPPRYFDVCTGDEVQSPPHVWHLDDRSAPAYVVGPAFFDPQINGFAGVDFQSPDVTRDELEHAARALHRAGCAHCLITLITAEADFLEAQLAHLANFVAGSGLLSATMLGFHLEGPFLSPEPGYRGAHPPDNMRAADFSLFERWQYAAGGRIRLLTVAPECEGVLLLVPRVVAGRVLVSLGHTNASSAQLSAAVRAGARLFTHLGNGMPPETHRASNIVQRVLAIPELMVSLIADGLHVPVPAFGNLTRALGPGRLVLTTDAASPAGAGPGRYRFGHLDLEVATDGVVRLPGTSQFAGSSLTPLAGFWSAVRIGGLGLDSAWRAWTHLRSIIAPEVDPPLLALPFGCGPSLIDPRGE